MKNRTFFRL